MNPVEILTLILSFRSILILSSKLLLGLLSDLFPSGFPAKTERIPYILYVCSISPSMKSLNYEVPHYIIFSSLMLPHIFEIQIFLSEVCLQTPLPQRERPSLTPIKDR